MNAPFDGNALFRDFFVSHGEPRGDEHLLHMSDITACDFATKLRLNGEPQLPLDDDTIGTFMLGHAVEQYLGDMLLPLGWTVTNGREVTLDGVVGHIDFDLEHRENAMKVVVDVTTTKARSTDYKEGHALKSAGYAMAIGAEWFAELVVQLGFGVVKAAEWHWFRTADYAAKIEAGIARLKVLRDATSLPVMAPPKGEEWRCKAYCSAYCPLNGRLAKAEMAS